MLQTSGKDRAQAFVFALQSQARLNRSLLWKDAWRSNIPHVFLFFFFFKQFNIAYNLTCAQKHLLFQSRADCLTRMFKQLRAGNITACVHTCVCVCVCTCVCCTLLLWVNCRLMTLTVVIISYSMTLSWCGRIFQWGWFFQKHLSSAWCPKRLSMIYVNINIKTDLVLSNRR